jgi:acyl carrier protein
MELESKIREFIVNNLYYSEDSFIGDEDSFLETGVIDSMGVMELVAFVQKEFGVEVVQKEIVVENFDSIRKLANYLRRKLSPVRSGEGASERPPLSGTASLAN